MERVQTLDHPVPAEIRKLRREWVAATILCVGEMLFAILVLVKFPMPDLARITLGCIVLALPVLWRQSHGHYNMLLESFGSQTLEQFELSHKLFVLSISRPCGMLTILLLAIAVIAKNR